MLKNNPITPPILPSITPETSQIVSQEKLTALFKEITADLERARSYCDASYINIQEAYMELQELKPLLSVKKNEEEREERKERSAEKQEGMNLGFPNQPEITLVKVGRNEKFKLNKRSDSL